MELSDVSKLAIELCQELGVPYSFGKGYATLDGIPMNQLKDNNLPLFREQYQISRGTMEKIMQQYLHPSREDAIAREKMMREISLHMSSRMEGTSEIVSYDDLDLSFLNDIKGE